MGNLTSEEVSLSLVTQLASAECDQALSSQLSVQMVPAVLCSCLSAALNGEHYLICSFSLNPNVWHMNRIKPKRLFKNLLRYLKFFLKHQIFFFTCRPGWFYLISLGKRPCHLFFFNLLISVFVLLPVPSEKHTA